MTRKVTEVHYETKGGLCTTTCPLWDGNHFDQGGVGLVGSYYCEKCKHFIRKDLSEQTVRCDAAWSENTRKG
jgi:hypothetical protein